MPTFEFIKFSKEQKGDKYQTKSTKKNECKILAMQSSFCIINCLAMVISK